MNSIKCPVIAIANQKCGVGKTITTINLAQGICLSIPSIERVLEIDFDPQGNFTAASGIPLESVKISISDLIRGR